MDGGESRIMDLMEHVKRPVVDKVKFQVLGGRAPSVEGTLCITAFFLIFSTRKQNAEDEVTVSCPFSH